MSYNTYTKLIYVIKLLCMHQLLKVKSIAERFANNKYHLQLLHVSNHVGIQWLHAALSFSLMYSCTITSVIILVNL